MTEVKLDHPGGQLSMPVQGAVEGPAGIGVSKLLKETGMTHIRPRFREHRVLFFRDHLHRR